MNNATGKPIEQNGQEVAISFEFKPKLLTALLR